MHGTTESAEFLHRRYTQQAEWTRALRRQAYAAAGLATADRVLEVGCGTGVILSDLEDNTPAAVFGIDLVASVTRFARGVAQRARIAVADGIRLPFAGGSFGAAVAHFLLLWVGDPLGLLQEMARVTRRGGWVLCLAEPDYGGRIDHPEPLAALGCQQAEALRDRGAAPHMGRRLRGLFARAGLVDIRSGVLGAEWTWNAAHEPEDTEWPMLEADLEGRVPHAELERLKGIDQRAWRDGDRVLFVPTFYAWGRKVGP